MSKSDIARQFDLPERQSKLATMLREEGLKDEQVYCVCRSTDISRFMIGCDQCEEWYHGDCINVTENEANKIRKFYCIGCRQKNPSLTIKYKQKKKHSHERDDIHRNDRDNKNSSSHSHKKSDKKRYRCGECEACYIKEDCGRCEPCKDKPKFGGPGLLEQKCKKRQCINFYHLAKKHRDHLRSDHTYNSSPKYSFKHIEPTITVEHVRTPSRDKSPDVVKRFEKPNIERPQLEKQDLVRTNEKINQNSQVSTEVAKKKEDKEDLEWNPSILKSLNGDEDPWNPNKRRKLFHKELKSNQKSGSKAGRKRKIRREESDSDEPNVLETMPRQCFGPQCIKCARTGSKYCSDECGLKLAENRIYSVLPQRVREWHMFPCVSTERDRKTLEKLQEQQTETKNALANLDKKLKDLDEYLDRVKSLEPLSDQEAEEEEIDSSMYCVTCGHEISGKKAVKHMHQCYNKLESQMCFGSMYKTKIEGNNMFCDYYNPASLTYCKRLKVMCPEHTKDPKVSNSEVCGFPLTENIFTETGEPCRARKKDCMKHYQWAKLRRATIDMERVRQCIKFDEYSEQERATRAAMTNRAGVLGLMLHSTYNHVLSIRKPQETKVQREKVSQSNSDHHYHRNQIPVDKSKQKITKIPSKRPESHNHDHMYSSQQSGGKRHQDHIYYMNKKSK